MVVIEGQPYPTRCISSFFFIHYICEFYIDEEGKKNMIDYLEKRGRILVTLALYWCLHMNVQHVLHM